MIGLCLLPVVLGAAGSLHWIADVFSHFRVYYVVAFLMISAVGIFMKAWSESAVSFIIVLILGRSLVPFYMDPEPVLSDHSLKVVSLNLLSTNSEYQNTIEFIRNGDFDIIILQEINQTWVNELKVLTEDFPHQMLIPRPDNFGIGVMARDSLLNAERIDVSDTGIPSLFITVEHKLEQIHLIATHPLPPVSTDYFRSRNKQFSEINTFVNDLKDPVMVIGDLNSSVFSPNFSVLLENGRLRDSRPGFGLLSTWHAQWPLISVTLDHALVTEDIAVKDRRVGPDIGSDHLPVIIEISIR